MMLSRPEIKSKALESLRGKWLTAIIVFVIYMVIIVALSYVPRFGWLASLVMTGPVMLGIYTFFIKLVRGEEVSFNHMFDGFNRFFDALLLYILMSIFVLLWTLLLVIPGIIAGYRYSQAYFILRDNPELKPQEAIQRSKEMMAGHKMRLFILHLSFIGWYILSIITIGIGFLWLFPYAMASIAVFYDDLRKSSISTEPLQQNSNTMTL
jgi:uncharacterized membrane protein